MAKIPKPRGGGQTGGAGGQRKNRGTFRAVGGQVGKSKSGCLSAVVLFALPVAAFVGTVYYHIA